MNQSPNATASTLGQTEGFSAYLSAEPKVAPGGSVATPVNAPPNGTFIRALAFTAQPLASRIGPRLRLRSLSQASNIEGREIASRMPTIARGTCHTGNLAIAPNIPPSAPSKVARTSPMAASVPVSILVFGCSVGDAGLDGSAWTTDVAPC